MNDRLQVKSVKHSQFASHETLCFECSVYFDGKKVGIAENDGRGGETYISFTNRDVQKTVYDWAKTQPKIVTDLPSIDPQTEENFSYDFTPENGVDDLVSEFLDLRDLKRNLKAKLLIRHDESKKGQFSSVKLLPTDTVESLSEAVIAENKFKNPVVLNLLPIEEALKVWKS